MLPPKSVVEARDNFQRVPPSIGVVPQLMGWDGVRQGCMLALLFNLYLNELMLCNSSLAFHAPRLASKEIALLLYADDSILFSVTKICLRRLLKYFSNYCLNEEFK